ncbi:putative glutamate/gamma-aminobutyrate antiporter [Microbulbifer aggregans]|uniref:Putative glutamate/gamma-aminobutyrate antiporter n=1 Tax=Microbulbifer aggregans TaxID=1769779 RepID=A0A1C9W5G8_9GAMM|nr:APC family permease [Microbulbifer aggregans]AOS96405.1 putative glutamate/gamma-aminobutyrate antiporter [Microbulbifer aggregans]
MTDVAVKKNLGKRDMILFTVSAILLVDTLAATAAIGTSSIFWWLFLGLVFFVPFALVSAELGCAYPEKGGIYAWVRDAFGGRWGSRISWSYWVNVAIWMPAIFILFAGVARQLFWPEMGVAGQIGLGVALTWIAVLANVVTLNVGKWVPNIGAIFKIIIFGAIIAGAFFYAADNGLANPITLDSIKPTFAGSLQYIPAIIYGMLGFELISASSEEMRNPQRDVPRSILVSGIIILTLYILGTTAILAAIPAQEIDLVEGLVDTLRLFFAQLPLGDTLVMLLGLAALYTFFSNGVTWAIGGNRAAAEAAEEGELPSAFAIKSRSRNTPVGAAVLMGLMSTLILVLYGLLVESNEDLFWSLFAFSGVIFLLPYVGMFLAFIKMRQIDGGRPRPFRVPGGDGVALALTGLCVAVLLGSIFLFVYTPGEGVQWPVLIGSVVTLILGEMAILWAEKESAAEATGGAEAPTAAAT